MCVNRGLTLIRTVQLLAVLLALVVVPATSASAAATIVIVNTDAANVGFNDPTPVAPVGGNTGTTLGQQRLNVFQAVASVWGAHLNSSVTIRVDAAWAALSCTASSAVLGSAGATQVFSFSSGSGVFLNTWYPKALVNKLVGVDVTPGTADIRARFNVNLGAPNCLAGSPFYLGLDNNHGTPVDLFTVLLHELGHGLGFQSFTAQNGAYLGPPFQPSIFNQFQFDNTTSKAWVAMTDAERAASSINPRAVAWTGANVTSSVPQVMTLGTPRMAVTLPSSLTGDYLIGTATFGPPLASPGINGEVMPLTGTGDQLLGCLPFSAANSAAVNGHFALIDRGVCAFTTKVLNAQNAGAIGVLIADNVAGSPPSGLGGSDPTIVIPAVRISQDDGVKFRDFLRYRSRTHSGMFVTVGLNLLLRNGVDALGRLLLYTPTPFVGGSSVSHWDTSAFRNLLMEPNINGDLSHDVTSPNDVTKELLTDLGW